MSREYFVTPGDTVQLFIFGGDEWIEVKSRLTYGEEQRIAGAALDRVHFNQDTQMSEVGFNVERSAIDRIFTWVTEWSLTDPKTKKVLPVNRTTISNMTGETAREINRVLDEHEKKFAEKKSETETMLSDGTGSSETP